MSNESLKQYLLKGGAWAFLGKIATALLGALLSAILTRVLSPADMADFFLANSLAIFISLTGRFGLENTLLSLVAKFHSLNEFSRAKTTLVKGMLLVAGISIMLAIILSVGLGEWIFSSMLQSHNLTLVTSFIAIWSVLFSFQFLYAGIFRALKKINLAVIFGGVLTALLSVLLLVALWFSGMADTLMVVFQVVLFVGFINLLAGCYILFLEMKNSGRYESRLVQKTELLHSSWSFWINSIAHYLLGYSGLWIIGVYRVGFDVAQYGAASRLILLVGIPLVINNTIVPPLIAGLSAKNDNYKLERILRGTATVAAVPAMLLIVFLFIYAENVMQIVFGDSYGSGKNVFQILLVRQFFSLLSGSSGYLLMMTGNQKAMMNITLIFAVLSISLALCVVEDYGILGVALAGTAAIGMQQVATVLTAFRKTGIWSHVSWFQFKKFMQEDIGFRRQ